jgi:hypothetical protein
LSKIFYPELDQILTEFHDDIFFYDPDNILQGNLDNSSLTTMNIFRLIFGNVFIGDSVIHTFRYESGKDIYPPTVNYRVNMFKPSEVRYKDDGVYSINPFNFNQVDIDLLDQFRKFRQTDPTFTLAGIDFSSLTETGKNIYNILYYLDNGVFYFDPIVMVNNDLLAYITRLHSLHLKLKNTSLLNTTFITSNEQINQPEPGPQPVGPPPYP